MPKLPKHITDIQDLIARTGYGLDKKELEANILAYLDSGQPLPYYVSAYLLAERKGGKQPSVKILCRDVAIYYAKESGMSDEGVSEHLKRQKKPIHVDPKTVKAIYYRMRRKIRTD